MSIQLPDDSTNTGKTVETTDATTGVASGNHRESIRVAGATVGQIATVSSATPAASDYALSVRSEAMGAQADAAAATDTATSSITGLLKRIAQRITSLMGLLPSSTTVSGNFKVCISEDLVGSAVDTDDGSIAGAQSNIALVITEPHTFDGANWVRGGWTPHGISSAASTNATSVKGSVGNLGFVVATNKNASARYLKFYNKASAPTVGSDTPLFRFELPPASGVAIFFGEKGVAFSTGLAYALTVNSTDADTTAVAADDIQVNLGYK